MSTIVDDRKEIYLINEENKWLDFIAGINTIIVSNEDEFNKFRKFLDDLGIGKLLKNYRTFSAWKHLAIINNKNPNYLIFEFQITKGLTFGYTKESSKDWFGVQPLTVKDLESYYKNSKLLNKKNTNKLEPEKEKYIDIKKNNERSSLEDGFEIER